MINNKCMYLVRETSEVTVYKKTFLDCFANMVGLESGYPIVCPGCTSFYCKDSDVAERVGISVP